MTSRKLAQLAKQFPAWQFSRSGGLWEAHLEIDTRFATGSVALSSSTAAGLTELVRAYESAGGGA